jgi:hypothetical protein
MPRAAAPMPATRAQPSAGVLCLVIGCGLAIGHATLLNPKFFVGNRLSAPRHGFNHR